MGGNKKRRQMAAETQSGEAARFERSQAEGLKTELDKRRAVTGSGIPETMEATRTGAADLRETGGFKPGEIEPIKSSYSDMSITGGFTPAEKTNYLRRATAPIAAAYGRAKDELNRSKAVTGGFPGFTASTSRLTRGAAQAGAEASLNANVDLAEQVRSGRMAGTAGLERVAESVRSGRISGQDALQRYSQFGVSALSEIDITELRNRLQTGQISQADAALLTQLAAQDKTLFENIMQGIGTIGGAGAGVLAAI